MTYAVGNTLLTIWGMVIVMMLSRRILIQPTWHSRPPTEKMHGCPQAANEFEN